MASGVISTVPWTVFFVLEPISLFGGWYVAFTDPPQFSDDQIPTAYEAGSATVHSHVLSLMLGNLYLLMMLVCVGVIMHLKEAWALRNYLIILAIGDLGHLYGAFWGLGREHSLDFGNWNQMAWGNIGATVFLFVARLLTLAGVFGKMKDAKNKSS